MKILFLLQLVLLADVSTSFVSSSFRTSKVSPDLVAPRPTFSNNDSKVPLVVVQKNPTTALSAVAPDTDSALLLGQLVGGAAAIGYFGTLFFPKKTVDKLVPESTTGGDTFIVDIDEEEEEPAYNNLLVIPFALLYAAAGYGARNLLGNYVEDFTAAGLAVIAAAMLPYALGIYWPSFMNNKFFIPLYPDDAAGRKAEIGWKARFAMLGLLVTTFVYADVYFFEQTDPLTVLRDSYAIWGLFYVEAISNIFRQGKRGVLDMDKRVPVQIWHSMVAVILWTAADTNPISFFLDMAQGGIFSGWAA